MPVVLVPESAYEKLRRLAELKGATVEELVLDLVAGDMTPAEAAKAYWEVARGLLSRAEEELARGELRQASEKIWGAATLAVKAVALAREGRRLASHGELWRFVSELARREADPDIRRFWHVATSMHVNFYEGWADAGLVRGALEDVRDPGQVGAPDQGGAGSRGHPILSRAFHERDDGLLWADSPDLE